MSSTKAIRAGFYKQQCTPSLNCNVGVVSSSRDHSFSRAPRTLCMLAKVRWASLQNTTDIQTVFIERKFPLAEANTPVL